MTSPHLPSSSALASAASPASSPSSELAQWPRASALSPMPARSGSAWAPPPAAPASSAARQRTPNQAPPKKDDQDAIEWLPNAADPPHDTAADLLTTERPSPTLLAQVTNTVRQVDRGNLPGQTDTLAAPAASDANQRSVEQASAANRWSTDLLKPLSEHSPSAAAAWFGAAPTGAVLSGSAMGLMALSSSSKSAGSTPADTQAPNLLGAAISSSDTLVLRYNENLSTVLPAASAFQVMVDGSIVAVSSVARGSDQSSLSLTLATPVTSAQQVTVSTVDGSTIRDVAGNAAATFRDQAVTVTVTDQTAPTLQNFAAITNADTSYVVLRFSETLQSNTVLDPASFGIQVAPSPGINGTLQTIIALDVFGDTIRLTLANKITGTAPIVLLSYTPPADTSKAIQDSAGNRAVAIARDVTHSVDTSAPIVNTSGSDVAATDRQVREIRLNFNDNLDASALPSPDSFLINVTSGGSTSSGSPSSLKISGSQLILTLTTPVTDAAAGFLQLRYTPPSTGNALKDWAGNRVAAFERSVATVDGLAPSWVSSRFTSNQTLELTFDEALAPQTQAPNLDTWSLTANGGTVLKPTTSTVSGRTLTLGFGAAILSGQAATLTYTAPTLDASALNRALQDTLGNDSGNLSRTLDTAGPTLTTTGTSANGLQVLLNYNESLLAPNANGTPAVPAVSTGAYVVRRGDGTSIPVNSVTISGSQVQLGLATALKPGDTVSVFYTAPTANIGVNNAAVQDSSGNDAASLGSGVVGQAVTNNTAMAVAQVQLGSQTQALDKVVVQFNEAIGSGSLPAISAFTVKAGTVTQTITGIARDSTDNTKLVLTLSGTIDDPGALLVSYVAPNSSNNPITGASGKALGAFTDQNFGQLITSTSGVDTVTGAAGRVDYFLGSAGNDTLSGLGGADQFVWPDFGGTGPSGFTQTLKDFGFKKGIGALQGSLEADSLNLSQLLNGYDQGVEAKFFKAIKNGDNKLLLQIDHDGGATFEPTANLLFDNVTFTTNDQLQVNSQFIAHTVNAVTNNLTLANFVEHLRIEGQLTVL